MRRTHRSLAALSALLVAGGGLAACSDDDGGDDAAPSTTEAAAAPATTVAAGCTTDETGPMEIVLVNDDGVINPAIDVLLERLGTMDGIEVDVTVVAPADEKSGSSDTTTPGTVAYQETTTPGGNPAYAVEGFPADSVNVALGPLGLEPDLVVSGINPGQNFGPFASISGTVGAARTAIRQGVPALAVSGPVELDQAQFDAGAELAVDWITENCEAIVAGEAQTDTVTSINFPACAPEAWGELQEVPRATEFPPFPEGDSPFNSLCDLADPAPANDVAAVRAGYPSLTQVPPTL